MIHGCTFGSTNQEGEGMRMALSVCVCAGVYAGAEPQLSLPSDPACPCLYP